MVGYIVIALVLFVIQYAMFEAWDSYDLEHMGINYDSGIFALFIISAAWPIWLFFLTVWPCIKWLFRPRPVDYIANGNDLTKM